MPSRSREYQHYPSFGRPGNQYGIHSPRSSPKVRGSDSKMKAYRGAVWNKLNNVKRAVRDEIVQARQNLEHQLEETERKRNEIRSNLKEFKEGNLTPYQYERLLSDALPEPSRQKSIVRGMEKDYERVTRAWLAKKKSELIREGIERLEHIEKRLERMRAWRKRSHRLFIKKVFSKPVRFRLKDGKMVRVLSYGIEDTDAFVPLSQTRSLVAVFLGGKRIFFVRYANAKAYSDDRERVGGVAHRWIPVSEVAWDLIDRFETNHAIGYKDLEKFPKNPTLGNIDFWQQMYRRQNLFGWPTEQIPLQYPGWVFEVSRCIENSVRQGKIRLEPGLGKEEVMRFIELVNYFPPLAKTHRIDNRFNVDVLPD